MTPKQNIKMQAILTEAHHDYEKGLSVHAFFKVHNRMTSKDLVQDTFLKTWKYLVRGGKIDTMKAFLYHVLNNLIIDEYRKHKTYSLDALFEKGIDWSVEDSEQLTNRLDGKGAMLMIHQLPFQYQKVMQMRYVQDLSIKEMSLITGKSKNAVTVHAHRALAKLKTLYKLSMQPVA